MFGMLQMCALLGAKMESSGSDCDSNVDNDVSGSSVPDSGHYQSGM